MSEGGPRPIVLAITGASGAPYAVRLLQALVVASRPTWLIVSSHGWRLLETECGIAAQEALREAVGAASWDAWVTVHDDGDRGARPASGSARTAGMVICPCSMGTIAAVSQGTSRSLVERAADVTLKERRPLVLVPRETPFSAITWRTCCGSPAGATILPRPRASIIARRASRSWSTSSSRAYSISSTWSTHRGTSMGRGGAGGGAGGGT